MGTRISPEFRRAAEAEVRRLVEQGDLGMKDVPAIRSGQLTVQDIHDLRRHKWGAFRMNGKRPVRQPSFTSIDERSVKQYADRHTKPPSFVYRVMQLRRGHTRWHLGKRAMFEVY